MSKPLKSVMYLVGLTAVGTGLFYIFAPSQSSEKFKAMNENQGVLSQDRSDANRNTKNLLAKLKQGAGLDPDKKS